MIAELACMGVTAEEDESGNLLARIPGRNERSLLLCAHLDTVETEVPIEPVLVDGQWENAHEGILGADNKAAVAVMLETARRATVEGSPVGIELLFTVSEEDGLVGAKAFDVSRLRSEFGYVFDHATLIGEVVVAAPTYFRLEASFRGKAAHAGIRPEDGRSAILAAALAIAAMPLGRIDAQTTANVGSVRGGVGSTNVVPERCRVLAEARSLDPSRVEDVVAGIVEAVHDGAAQAECDVDVVCEKLFTGFKVRTSAPELVAAEAALRTCGYEPRRIQTGGGLRRQRPPGRRPCLNLANGTEWPTTSRPSACRSSCSRGCSTSARAARGGRRGLMLMLRRGVVLAAGDPGGPMQELEVVARRRAADGGGGRGAGGRRPGGRRRDRERRRSRRRARQPHPRLSGTGTPGAQAIKLAYTSLQHAVTPVEDAPAESPLVLPTDAPVAVCLTHSQLAPLVGVPPRRAGRPARLRTDRRRRARVACPRRFASCAPVGCSPAI